VFDEKRVLIQKERKSIMQRLDDFIHILNSHIPSFFEVLQELSLSVTIQAWRHGEIDDCGPSAY